MFHMFRVMTVAGVAAVLASPVVAAPAAGFSAEVLASAQRACAEAGGAFSGDASQFACKIDTDAARLAIKTKGTSAHRTSEVSPDVKLQDICSQAGGRYTGDSHICTAARRR